MRVLHNGHSRVLLITMSEHALHSAKCLPTPNPTHINQLNYSED